MCVDRGISSRNAVVELGNGRPLRINLAFGSRDPGGERNQRRSVGFSVDDAGQRVEVAGQFRDGLALRRDRAFRRGDTGGQLGDRCGIGVCLAFCGRCCGDVPNAPVSGVPDRAEVRASLRDLQERSEITLRRMRGVSLEAPGGARPLCAGCCGDLAAIRLR